MSAKAKVLGRRVKYYDQLEASGLYTYTIASKERPDAPTLDALGVRSRYCCCAYDCCGCVQIDAPRVDHRVKRGEWLVSQHWYRCV